MQYAKDLGFAYDKIFCNEEPFEEGSKLTRNFKYFYDRLTRKPYSLTFDQLLEAIERLQIISIELDADDDAQLIFESLNSTGLALTEADKIRNYLLMSLSQNEQMDCFKNYWQKIESATDNQPTRFLRDYHTIVPFHIFFPFAIYVGLSYRTLQMCSLFSS